MHLEHGETFASGFRISILHPVTQPSLCLDFTQKRRLRRVWEFGFNTCHAPIVMRSDVQAHMGRAHAELGMKYWRCHGTLSDDVGVVFTDEKQRLHYCFSGLRRILDAGLATRVTPFLELSFMPAALARDPASRLNHYQSITSPPKDFRKWRELVRKTVTFLAETYGLVQIRRWYFEVWNEPNIPFWAGDQIEYFELYREAALAIKSVDAGLRVGGPATARAAWVADLLDFCRRTGTPLDFLSTHIYPSDVPFLEGARGDVNLLGIDFVHGHFARVRREADAASFSGPIIWGEWNSSAGPLVENHDDCNNAALVAGMLAGIEEFGDGSLFWNVSDIYEECGFHFAPFHGGYGLYTVDGVAKSAARAFEMFQALLPYRVHVQNAPESRSRGLLASTDRRRSQLAIVLWNHRESGHHSAPWKATIDLGGFQVSTLERRRILPGRGSAFETWREAGKPMTLTPHALQALQRASRPAEECRQFSAPRRTITFTVAPGSMELLLLR